MYIHALIHNSYIHAYRGLHIMGLHTYMQRLRFSVSCLNCLYIWHHYRCHRRRNYNFHCCYHRSFILCCICLADESSLLQLPLRLMLTIKQRWFCFIWDEIDVVMTSLLRLEWRPHYRLSVFSSTLILALRTFPQVTRLMPKPYLYHHNYHLLYHLRLPIIYLLANPFRADPLFLIPPLAPFTHQSIQTSIFHFLHASSWLLLPKGWDSS